MTAVVSTANTIDIFLESNVDIDSFEMRFVSLSDNSILIIKEIQETGLAATNQLELTFEVDKITGEVVALVGTRSITLNLLHSSLSTSTSILSVGW